jgi:hypothetical protein
MPALAESFPGRPATADITSQARKINSDDLEKQHISPALERLDIEHAIVQDDPRDWSRHRKVCHAVLTSSRNRVVPIVNSLCLEYYFDHRLCCIYDCGPVREYSKP